MRAGGVYSLKQERLYAERQQSIIRVLLAVTTSLILWKLFTDQSPTIFTDPLTGETIETLIVTRPEIILLSIVLLVYSIGVWVGVWWKPDKLKLITAFSSGFEILLITYLVYTTAGSDSPFYLWYVFYVVSVATRYGLHYSVLALSASIVSFTAVVYHAPQAYAVNLPALFGFTGFLLVLSLLFGQISEKQLSYQASLSVVNEFRAELAGLANSRDIVSHLLARTRGLLNVEEAFFLPAERGADGSQEPGLRSAGADSVLMATFREQGGDWNVNEILKEQRPQLSNNLKKDLSLPMSTVSKLGLRNLGAAPLMVRSTPVGVVYAANRKDRRLTTSDLQLLELIATQAAPVIENALLWERLREAAASEERLRIARDLHDNFLQTLAAIKLHLERCKILLQKDVTKTSDGIDRIHQIATRGLAEVRSYLSELRLMGPEPSRFREAIARCAEEAATRGGFATTLDVQGPEEPMPPNVALAAFQIARELLNNAATHSKAQNVKVTISAENRTLQLEVADDGVGFDVARTRAEKASQGHLGLVGVEERARQSSGDLTITSEPGKGTRAVATLSF